MNDLRFLYAESAFTLIAQGDLREYVLLEKKKQLSLKEENIYIYIDLAIYAIFFFSSYNLNYCFSIIYRGSKSKPAAIN